MWKAEFCIGDGPEHLFKHESEDINEIKQWALGIQRTEGLQGNVFNSDFAVDGENVKQWGTGYFWLYAKRED